MYAKELHRIEDIHNSKDWVKLLVSVKIHLTKIIHAINYHSVD